MDTWTEWGYVGPFGVSRARRRSSLYVLFYTGEVRVRGALVLSYFSAQSCVWVEVNGSRNNRRVKANGGRIDLP